MDERGYLLWLANIVGIPKRKKLLLWKEFQSGKEIYQVTESALRHLMGRNITEQGQAFLKPILTDKEMEAFIDSKKKWDVEGEYVRLSQREEPVKFVTIGEEHYPKRLKPLVDAPFILYYLGGLPKEEKRTIAIIGARNCSEYGKQTARLFGSILGKCGIQVVSGMARGIDGLAQRAALESEGTSFGILGTGINICYPEENRELYQDLIHQGGVISEYRAYKSAAPQMVAARIRNISGLSDE